MSSRARLQAAATTDPQELLTIWRQERSLRVALAVCYLGLFLTAIATVADFFWSAPSVLWTDFVLLAGLGTSLVLAKMKNRPSFFWWPAFISLYIAELPSLLTTGGITSPLFGVELTVLYVVGVVMDPKHRSSWYLAFALIHIPIFYLVELNYPLALQPPVVPIELTAVVTAATMGAIFMCLHAILRTEAELAREFAEHYKSLLKTESQLREAQSIAQIGNWEWDIKADKIIWSDELFKIFGIKKENFDPSFRAYLNRQQPEMKERIQQKIKDCMTTGADYLIENRISTPEGEKYILSRGRAVRNDLGQTIRLRGTSQDISDRKRIESQLIDARAELERRVQERTEQLNESLEREKNAKEEAVNASQAKMQFLAHMSHEIRTPMNSIMGFSDLLSNNGNSVEDTQDYIARIRANGSHLLHLIDDILDLSKFEAGQIPVHKSQFNLKTLIDDVVNSFQPVLARKGLTLEWTYEPEDGLQVITDGHRLSQILTNLLSNAIKFTSQGAVKLKVQGKERNPSTLDLSVDVEDSGIGISTENQKNLFQPFSQGDSSIARKFGGTGLGLALSRRIADAMGGDLRLHDSRPGVGSHFVLELPLQKVTAETEVKPTRTAPAKAPINSQNFQDKKILLAEDAPDNAFLICHYLRSMGATIDVATDGLQALKMAGQKSYDCILMDIQMPGMDGLEATRKIRSAGYTKPIIALTAHALPSESQKSIQAGCTLHLTKPINKADLISTLGEQLKS